MGSPLKNFSPAWHAALRTAETAMISVQGCLGRALATSSSRFPALHLQSKFSATNPMNCLINEARRYTGIFRQDPVQGNVPLRKPSRFLTQLNTRCNARLALTPIAPWLAMLQHQVAIRHNELPPSNQKPWQRDCPRLVTSAATVCQDYPWGRVIAIGTFKPGGHAVHWPSAVGRPCNSQTSSATAIMAFDKSPA